LPSQTTRFGKAAAFLGHSTVVANKHYLQVTDEHFASAIASPTNQNDAESDALTAHSVEKVTHNPTQQPAAPTGTAPQNPSTSREKRPFMRKSATTCEVVQLPQVPPRGAQLSDDSPRNRPVSKVGGAECDAFSDVDLELVALIPAWAELPESVKDAVLEMVGG
jgi:hypothetical protein